MNNQGNIQLAEQIALKDIKKYLDSLAKDINIMTPKKDDTYYHTNDYWAPRGVDIIKGYYFVTSTILLSQGKEIRKLNKLIINN